MKLQNMSITFVLTIISDRGSSQIINKHKYTYLTI